MDIQALQITNAHLDLIIEFIAVYLIQRYIFLEQGFRSRIKQDIYYGISLILVLGITSLFGEYAGAVTLMCTDGLNLTLSKAEQIKAAYPDRNLCRSNAYICRQYTNAWVKCILSFFLAVPIFGISTGLATTLICTPTILFDLSSKTESWYQLVVLTILLIMIIAFAIARRGWRERFEKDLASARLMTWEFFLLCVTGCLTLFSSEILNRPISDFSEQYGEEAAFAYGRSLGVLGLISFFLIVTVIVLVIINNQKAYLDNKVSDMQLNIITMMADIVENRDANTGGHIRRTARYVEIIANELKKEGTFEDVLTDQYISDMIIAAPLHDIGKIHVSDMILNKEGPLDPGEFEQMKSHAPEGRKLLLHARDQIGDFSYINIAIDMAGCHHEWWDGSAKGYPDHISGNDIPLCARIMAVADVFDALISKRCYKDPMPLPKAYAIIDSESGTHFDPAVVQAFDSRKPEIEAAISEFGESEI